MTELNRRGTDERHAQLRRGRPVLLTLVLLEGLAELVDHRGHLESLHEDSLLSLNTDVTRPLDKAGEVTLWLDVSSKSEVASVLLEERPRSSASATSTSFGLNDLLSLSFLHLNGTTKAQVRSLKEN